MKQTSYIGKDDLADKLSNIINKKEWEEITLTFTPLNNTVVGNYVWEITSDSFWEVIEIHANGSLVAKVGINLYIMPVNFDKHITYIFSKIITKKPIVISETIYKD